VCFLLPTLPFINLLTACPLFDVESSFIAIWYLEFVFSHHVYCFSNFLGLLFFQIWLIRVPPKLFMNIVQINFLYPHFLQVYCAMSSLAHIIMLRFWMCCRLSYCELVPSLTLCYLHAFDTSYPTYVFCAAV
jgi:hypothetical protein